MVSIVVPSLLQEKWVVSDRSVVSDWAYRPYHGNHVRRRHTRLFNKLNPIVFYVDVDTDTATERMVARGALNEFEKAHVINKIDDLKSAYENVSFYKIGEHIPVSWIHNNGTIEDSWAQVEAHLMADGLYEHLQ